MRACVRARARERESERRASERVYARARQDLRFIIFVRMYHHSLQYTGIYDAMQ